MIFLLFIRLVLLAMVIIYGPFSLSPDEAQYWTWSQDLSIGYYSKPPGIAWQIFLSSLLFGDTEWGIRSSALFIGTLLPLFLAWAAIKGGYGKKVAFWSGVTLALTPVGVIGSILAVTDGGMLLFWTIAMGIFLEALHLQVPPKPLYLGGALALGALFKWPIYILVGVIFLFVLVYVPQWKKTIFKTVGISLLGLVPSLLWNIFNEGATFRHVGSILVGGNEVPGISKSNFLEFIGAQAALFSPLLFFFFWLAIYRILKNRKISLQTYFLFLLTMTLLVPIGMSLFEKMQGNWAIFIFPSAVLLTVADMISLDRRGWLITSLTISAILTAGILALPAIQERAIGNIEIPFKSNPFKSTLGWRGLTKALEHVGYNPSQETLIAESYQMTSLLSFYSPGQKRAYFVNLSGRRHNQFDYWPQLENDPRKEGLFVVAQDPNLQKDNKLEFREKIQSKLESRFKSVTFLGDTPLFEAYGKVVRIALLFRVNGYQPTQDHVRPF